MRCAEMARRLGQPVRTIRYRLERLRKSNAIHISAVVDPEVFGYSVVADVLLEVEAGQALAVARAAAKLEQVSYAACSTGNRDVSIQVLARDTDDLYRFITEMVQTIPGVHRSQTYLLPVRVKDVYQWYPPSPVAHE